MATSIPFLNDCPVEGESIAIVIVLPNRHPDDLAEYLVFVSPEQTVLDLKKILKEQLKTKPKTFDQRVIYRGRILENHHTFSSLSLESTEGHQHFHIMINNVPKAAPIQNHIQEPIQEQPSSQTPDQPDSGFNANFHDINSPDGSRFRQSDVPVQRPSNDALVIGNEALQSYLSSLNQNIGSSANIVQNGVYYQHVTINNQDYLVQVPISQFPPMMTAANVRWDPQRNRFIRNSRRRTAPVSLRSRMYRMLRRVWPAFWLIAKLLFFYAFFSAGGSIYKHILFFIIALVIFAFQNGLIGIQIQIEQRPNPNQENLRGENQNQPEFQNQPEEQNQPPNSTNPIPAPQDSTPAPPRHPILEGVRTFFTSLIPDPQPTPAAGDGLRNGN